MSHGRGVHCSISMLLNIVAVILLVMLGGISLGIASPANADEVPTVQSETGTNKGAGEGQINIRYDFEDLGIEGVTFRLYLVAQEQNGHMQPVGKFAQLNDNAVNWGVLVDGDSEQIHETASRLAKDVENITADMKIMGYAKGALAFSGLEDGTYLVVGQSTNDSDLQCEQSTILVQMPAAQTDNNNSHAVTIRPKFACTVPGSTVSPTIQQAKTADTGAATSAVIVVGIATLSIGALLLMYGRYISS